MSRYTINPRWEAQIRNVIEKATEVYDRASMFRFDLRFPDNGAYSDEPMLRDAPSSHTSCEDRIMTQFIESLKAQVKADIDKRVKYGTSYDRTEVIYAWKREASGDNGKTHYHLIIIVNKDCYQTVGKFSGKHNLAYMIKTAWSRVLGLPFEDAEGLVHFPKDYYIWLVKKSPDFEKNKRVAIKRAGYLAKNETVLRGDGRRNIGYSIGIGKHIKEE